MHLLYFGEFCLIISVLVLTQCQGTTSNPKGVVLTHGHLAMACQSNLSGSQLSPGTILFSYLPLAHIYEVSVQNSLVRLASDYLAHKSVLLKCS